MSERRELALQVIDEVEKAVVGKRKILEKIMTAILAGGHILIEDIPGTRKDNDGTCFFQGDASERNQGAVYPGCSSGRPYRIFHLSERNRTVCLSAGSGYV